MPSSPWLRCTILALIGLCASSAWAGRPRHEAPGHLTFTSPQVSPIALSPDASLVLVASTSSNQVDVLSTATNARIAQVPVGIEPVSVAFRPDGLEAWVANHVSDTVSVIDTDPASASFLRVIETVQDLDENGATRFDEPTGIAFASDAKAFVALSSRGQIAVVDAASYAVTGSIFVSAQEPRAIAVRNGRLYVAAFESGNQSELSICATENNANAQCTLGVNTTNPLAGDLFAFAASPNLPNEDKNIVIDPQVPDRDLFVFDAASHAQLKVVSGVGTLLYGLAVDGSDRVYVTQTDARNEVNGVTAPAAALTDPNGDGDVNLADLDNRMFSNEMAILDCAVGGASCTVVSTVDLDGGTPSPATALATPYGVAVSEDGATVFGTAAGTSRLFAMSAAGAVLGRLDVGAIPRGVALRSSAGSGAPQTAYVFDSLANAVRVVNVSVPSAMTTTATIPVGNDPTPLGARLGAIAFNNAFASSNGTFSCGSCHPDSNTDQLLWRIGGACSFTGCVVDEDEPRSTMPVRGLRDTVPLHWDGTLGDPFGGSNGAIGGGGSAPANCSAGSPHGCFRQLSDASLSGVMCDQTPSCAVGPSGLPGLLTAQEREDLATFLERVSYPPARSRRVDDSVSTQDDAIPVLVGPTPVGALEGFRDFFTDRGGAVAQPDTCADSDAGCHELPLGTATNSETLAGFEAPTMRGMTDRFLHFSNGISNAEEFLVLGNAGIPSIGAPPIEAAIAWDPAGKGFQEITTFGAMFGLFQLAYGMRPLDLFQMFEEASTGSSGALGRQVTLNTRTANGALAAATEALLAELEAADERGVVNLRGSGLQDASAVTISYAEASDRYNVGGSSTLSRAALLAQAQSGALLATLTAYLRSGANEEVAQPLIAPVGAQCGTGDGATGDPALPSGSTITIEAAHVAASDAVFLNGAPTSATITLLGPATVCSGSDGPITTQLVQVSGLSLGAGIDLLQIRNAVGLLSNELPLP